MKQNSIQLIKALSIVIGFALSVFPSSNLINEAREIIDQYLSDGLITFTQYQYIINKMEEAPDCSEIIPILEDLSTDDFQNLIEEYCLQEPIKKPIGPKEIHLRTQVQKKVFPKLPGESHPLWGLKLDIENLSTTLHSTENPTILDYRKIEWDLSPISVQAGQIKMDNNQKFVLGKSFWSGHQPIPSSYGFIWSENRNLNGVYGQYSGSHTQYQVYTGWNRNSYNGHHAFRDSLDILTYGSSQVFIGRYLDIHFQEQWTRYEPYVDKPFHHGVGGIQLQENIFKRAHLETGYSWHTSQSSPGLIGKVTVVDPDTRSSFTLFQANNQWSNPLMDPSFQVSDSLAPFVSSNGRGEGGWQMHSRVPTYKWGKFQNTADLSTHIRWALEPLRYRVIRFGNKSKWHSLSHQLNIRHTTSKSQEYASIQNKFSWEKSVFRTILDYSHKTGHYNGSYPRYLKWELQYKKTREHYKLILSSRNITDPWKLTQLMFLQVWKLSHKIQLDTGLKLPFSHFQLDPDFYYQIKLASAW